MKTLEELLQLIFDAKTGSEKLDAEITAFMTKTLLKPYPPQTDFGPQAHWQFWSADGQHFLGNESKFRVEGWTRDLACGRKLVPEGWTWVLRCEPGEAFASVSKDFQARFLSTRNGNVDVSTGQIFKQYAATPELALAGAALHARTASHD